MRFQVQGGSWVQAFASPLVGNHIKMAGKEYKSKQIRGFNFCTTKSKKKNSVARRWARKSPAEDVPEGATGKMEAHLPAELWTVLCSRISRLSTVNMWGQIILCCEKLSWIHMGTSSCIHVPIVATIKNVSRQCQMLPEGQTFLVENYSSTLLTPNVY